MTVPDSMNFQAIGAPGFEPGVARTRNAYVSRYTMPRLQQEYNLTPTLSMFYKIAIVLY